MAEETATQSETRNAIMEATYTALCKHGSADVTIQKIADEFEKSKSLLYYHFDTKDEILIAFLGFLFERFEIEDAVDVTEDPEAQLYSLIDTLLPASLDEEQREFQVALLELRSRALSNEEYREQFARLDHLIYDSLFDILTAGIEDGTFRTIDEEQTAEWLLSTLNGAMLRQATADDDALQNTRSGVYELIESQLIAQ